MLLDYVRPQPGEVLYDLGCGSGRPMLAASMAWPELHSCVGIELMPQVYELGNKVALKFNSLCTERNMPHAPVSVICGDILEIDWSSADIIFFASVLFPVDALEAAADQMARLKPGTRIISLREMPKRDYLTLEAACFVRFSWGIHEALFYKRAV